jgi:hypothetical protein
MVRLTFCASAAGSGHIITSAASVRKPLVSDHCRAFHHACDERFAPVYGDWRPVVREVADKFLAWGVLDHGFARVRSDACTHEYLLAFSCKARNFDLLVRNGCLRRYCRAGFA